MMLRRAVCLHGHARRLPFLTVAPGRYLVHHGSLPRRLPLPSGILRTQTGLRRLFGTSSNRRAIVPFKLHDIGEGITEVEMLKWKVEEGQRVEHFDDLCEVQSDKSTADLTSPTPGIVHSIKIQEGETVKVGQTLCEIRTDEEGEVEEADSAPVADSSDDTIKEATGENDQVVQAERASEEVEKQAEHTKSSQDITPVTESITPSSSHQPTPEVDLSGYNDDTSTGVRFTGEAAILPSAPPPVQSPISTDPVPPRRERKATVYRKTILSSPAVRTLAARLGVDLAEVEGTGEKGRITREDVEAFAPSSSASAASSAPSQTDKIRSELPETTRVEFGRTRKVMWKALGSQGDVPHFGYTHTLDLTPLLPYLKTLNPGMKSSKQNYLASDIPTSLVRDPSSGPSPEKITLLSFLVKGLLLALEEHPIMRARVMKKDDERYLEIRRDGVVGVAVSDPKYGLVTPSLPPLSPSTSISAITTHLSAIRAQPTKVSSPPNLVISSVGGLGESTGAMPIIPPGGAVAICAVGRAKWEVEWKQRDAGMKMSQGDVEAGGMRAVLRCPVGWSGDHRVLEGAELIAFTESWKKWIEEPWRWIKADG